MNDRFVYDEKTSRLFAPAGRLLKRVFCPKAMDWNQLTADDPADRSRGRRACGQRVLNLDVLSTDAVLAEFAAHGSAPCVFAAVRSDRVVVLKDRRAPPPPAEFRVDGDGRVAIRTARSVAGINRAARMGYWSDVRFVQYKTRLLKTKLSIAQDRESGEVQTLGDFRGYFEPPVFEVQSFTNYYPYYQRVPIAAYLIPRAVPDGTPIVALDPIEDVAGTRWNQGSVYRATRVPGVVEGRRVRLDLNKVQRYDILG